jgi:hypothetical protein
MKRYGELARQGREVDGLMAEVRPGPKVRQAWQEVRARWMRVAALVGGP